MTVGEQLRWWGLGFALFLALVWMLADPLLPFILGAGIAYLADPLADRLEAAGLSRLMATVALSVGLVGIGLLAVLIVVPLLAEQVRNLIANAPATIALAQAQLAAWVPEAASEAGFFARASQMLAEKAESWSVAAIESIWLGGLAVVDFVLIVVVTPVVAFYLLYDWDNLVAEIDSLTPREHQQTIRKLALELDDVLAGFIRGQLTVCLILGTFYGVALTLVGLQFGLLVGMFAGLISFIPFVGSILGGAISLGIAVVQFWGDPLWIGVVAGIFVAGQAVEGNYLTPKLVGGHVKLHPVWLMLALSVAGTVMGFVGMLVAVPVAAAFGVLARFLVGQYRTGRLYLGDPAWRAQQELEEAHARDEARALAAAEARAHRDAEG